LIAHNGIAFDAYLLNKLWGMKIRSSQLTDTLILSRLLNPEIAGGHSLAAWGERLRHPKSEFSDFDSGWSQEMQDYCIQDTKVTAQLFHHLTKELASKGFSQECQSLEHSVQAIIAKQIRNGWRFDTKAAMMLRSMLSVEQAKIESEMQQVFEPTIVQLKTKQRIEPFNPGSRQQIADRLIKRGWKPTEKTEKGSIVVNEKTLEACDIPEAKVFLRYMMLQKRVSSLDQWINAAEKDGRVHGKIITNGAVTGRMTHMSPNMGQVVALGKEYGKECRVLFLADDGEVLVGIDASGLELRMLAHYMNDADYVIIVTTGTQDAGTDVHTVNQRAAGLATRAQAKTFIFAVLYGAGYAKVGSIIGGDEKEGKQLVETFMKNLPALAKLREKVIKYANKGYVPGLDGRKIWTRSPHSALNSLLQGAGAVVMKKALVLLDSYLKAEKIGYKFVGNIHDEIQLTTSSKHAERVGELGRKAIQDAGLHFNLRCPLDGAYNIGKDWSESH
jgi:DNA polymerase I-like protein with 3'-5' exonuclease and polymerase domains